MLHSRVITFFATSASSKEILSLCRKLCCVNPVLKCLLCRITDARTGPDPINEVTQRPLVKSLLKSEVWLWKLMMMSCICCPIIYLSKALITHARSENLNQVCSLGAKTESCKNKRKIVNSDKLGLVWTNFEVNLYLN